MKILKISIFLISVILVGCKVASPVSESDEALQFQSVFPEKKMQSAYETFTKSVVKLTAFVNYQTILFEPESAISIDDISDEDGLAFTRARLVQNESFSGTATIIGVEGGKALLMACAHNVSFADTLLTYSDKADSWGNRYLLGISIKTAQVLQVGCAFGTFQARAIALDAENDLVLLELKSETEIVLPPPVNLKPVSLSELHWGDRLWLCGYPSGRFMMTSGLISKPDEKQGILMTDAPFSDGYSGAPALVYDLQSGEFRLAGIGRSVAARSVYVLKPEKKIHEAAYNTSLPYTGPTYVETEKQAVPGVTFVTSSDIIRRFLEENYGMLAEHDWQGVLDDFMIED